MSKYDQCPIKNLAQILKSDSLMIIRFLLDYLYSVC